MKNLLAFAFIFLAMMNPALALQYQGSSLFVINQNGKKRILINANPGKIEVKANRTDTVYTSYECGGYRSINFSYISSSDKLLRVQDGDKNIILAEVPTFQYPECFFNQLSYGRPEVWFVRGRKHKTLALKTTSTQATLIYQDNQIVNINRCGFGFLGERKRIRSESGERIEEIIPLPDEFLINGQTYNLASLPTINSEELPVCRTAGGVNQTYLPINWGR